MTKEELTKDLREAFKKVAEKHTVKYLEGKNNVAYSHVTFNSDCSRILLTIWPDSEKVDICYAAPELPYGDTGLEIASINLNCFPFDQMIELAAVIANQYMHWW